MAFPSKNLCVLYIFYISAFLCGCVFVEKKPEQYKKPTYRKHVKYFKKYNDFNLNGYAFERKFQRFIFIAYTSKNVRYKLDFYKKKYSTHLEY